MRILLAASVIALTVLVLWSLIITPLYFNLRRRMRGLNEPELWLPKAEREEHARKLLRREDEQYMQQQIERYTNYIQQPHEER